MTINRKGLALKRDNGGPPDVYLDATGNLAFVEDVEAVGQHVQQRLMTYAGEWFLDSDAGVTWLTEVLGLKYDAVIAEALTKAEILETDGVVDIDSFSVRFNRELRNLDMHSITVTTVYDEGVTL